MTKSSRWSVENATLMIRKNGGMVGGKSISHPSPGLKVLGAIDYLVNHCGFHIKKD